jgi:hypothetical protein
MHTTLQLEILKEGDFFGELDIDGRIILPHDLVIKDGVWVGNRIY